MTEAEWTPLRAGGPPVRQKSGPQPFRALRSVVRRMRGVGAELPQDDGVAVFNRDYLPVTLELQRRLESGWFRAPRATKRSTPSYRTFRPDPEEKINPESQKAA